MSQSVITIHLPEGTVEKLHTAEIDGWIGEIIVAPKLDLPHLLRRSEIQGLGIYVLIGDDSIQLDRKQIYIGQGDLVSRLNNHNRDPQKAFWDDKVVVIIAKDGSLNTAHCLHLESRLIELANAASIATMANSQLPPVPKMYAPDKTIAENFLENIQILLPVLGVEYFMPPKAVQKTIPTKPSVTTTPIVIDGQTQSTIFIYSTRNVSAEAQIINDDFVVQKGAVVSPTDRALSKAYSNLRAQLKKNGLLGVDSQSNKLTLTQDFIFNSPSAAAAVISGYNVNGRREWKVKGTQQTYDDWDQARVNAAAQPATMSPSGNNTAAVPSVNIG